MTQQEFIIELRQLMSRYKHDEEYDVLELVADIDCLIHSFKITKDITDKVRDSYE